MKGLNVMEWVAVMFALLIVTGIVCGVVGTVRSAQNQLAEFYAFEAQVAASCKAPVPVMKVVGGDFIYKCADGSVISLSRPIEVSK